MSRGWLSGAGSWLPSGAGTVGHDMKLALLPPPPPQPSKKAVAAQAAIHRVPQRRPSGDAMPLIIHISFGYLTYGGPRAGPSRPRWNG